MKTLLTLALAISAALALHAHADLAAPVAAPERPTDLDLRAVGRFGALGLETKEIASGRKITRNWESGYGSFDRDFARGKSIEVQIRNVSRTVPSSTFAEIIWFGSRLTDKQEFVFHREIKPVAIGAGASAAMIFDMPELKSSVLHLAALRQRLVSGSKYLGYVVLIRQGAVVSQWKGSTSTLQNLSTAPAVVSALLAELESSSRPPGRPASAFLR